MKKLFILFSILILGIFGSPAYCWVNHARDMFQENLSNIYVMNVRTFSAVDKNKNEIIELEKGETPGTFTGAVKRLDALVGAGVNMIHLLPITPVGKLKALGTAGSLYAMDDFAKINPQLDDKDNPMSVYEEAKYFVKEAHKRGIHVIVDLPSCGSYDMSLRRPELFAKDAQGNTIIPSDWSDVRLFRTKEKDGSLNQALFNEHKKFIDMVKNIGADGIRADVATIKPYEFWQDLILYARRNDPQFLFIAEASPVWTTPPVAQGADFTPYNKLVSAGFDGYLGNYMNYHKFTQTSDLFSSYNEAKKLGDSKGEKKSVILNFATHDDLSPVLVAPSYPVQLIWLAATLPGNMYFVNGFTSGDSYLYPYANQEADRTYTDNKNYYVHKGKLDIFNYSRRPGGQNSFIQKEFSAAATAKMFLHEITKTTPSIISTGNKDVFAYQYNAPEGRLLVIVNHSGAETSAKIRARGVSTFDEFMVLHYPLGKINFSKGYINATLMPLDIAVLVVLNQPTPTQTINQYSQK